MSAKLRSRVATPAFSLAEMVVSMTIMTVLVGAMLSAMMIASHAFPERNIAEQRSLQAADALAWMQRDISYATTVTTLSAREIVLTVPDRGHGGAGPETVRYYWSGTPGDPLIRQYNGGNLVALCELVQGFSLTLTRDVKPLSSAPRVLMLTENPPTARALARQAMFQTWGFSVSQIAGDSSVAALMAAMTSADVVYLPQENPGGLGGLLGGLLSGLVDLLSSDNSNPPVGVITELALTYKDLGISSGYTSNSRKDITITGQTHEITTGLSSGGLDICTEKEPLALCNGTLASGAVTLAEASGRPALVAIEYGATLQNGATAAARRVKVPLADSGFDISHLNSNGQKLLRRSIVWAGANIICRSVRISLRATDTPTLESEVAFVNRPRTPLQ